MPAYHSILTDSTVSVGNLALLPVRTKFRGPAPTDPKLELDIIDEAINYFKSNVFFKFYEIKSNSDRLLIYLTLYITECLKKLQMCSDKKQGQSEMYILAISKFYIPGEPGFSLNSVYAKPPSPQESDLMRLYLQQLRHETGERICEKLINVPLLGTGRRMGFPSRWWLYGLPPLVMKTKTDDLKLKFLCEPGELESCIDLATRESY
ncbi:unnamed protein product [Leptosia nina]|uniref:Actin-related protein 2/3 complex subunit 3 n=1 Tax=Leptosia nina TaxID=320188 RepID=A0AAV1JMJ1_9NEOP